MTKKTNAFLHNLFLFTGSIVFSAILAEVVLRIVLPAPISWKFPQEDYMYEPELGHWLKPNQQAFTHDKAVSTNSVGIRDKEYSSKPVSGVYRILALGDSQTFGNGLYSADTWPKQLETSLNKTGDQPLYEVINSGLPGSDTWQHEIILRRMLATYHPDAVVLSFYVNDVVKKPIPNPTSSQTTNTLKQRIGYSLKQSALLLTLHTAANSIQQILTPGNHFSQERAFLEGTHSPLIEERWDQVEESLSAMKMMCDSHKTPFVVVALPRRDQVDGRLPWEGYYKQLQTIAERHDIPVTSMHGPLQQAHKAHGKALFIPWDGHNSKLANRIIAQEIAGAVLDTRKVDQ